MKSFIQQLALGMSLVAIPAALAGYIQISNRLERIETKLSIFFPDKVVLTTIKP